MNADKRRWLGIIAGAAILLLASQFQIAAQEKPSTAKRIDLNSATAEQLDRLPEVGPKLAAAIVRFREKSGPFQRVEELLAVPGITKRRLEKIRPHVTVLPANGAAKI